LVGWIRIQEVKFDQIWPAEVEKTAKISCFEVLDFEGWRLLL
jgi:hypothetical protein